MANEVTPIESKPKQAPKMRASWQALVDMVKPHVVRIMTPRGSGTGFLLYYSTSKGFCAIATASHVVNHAHFWEEPIRLQHGSEESIILRPSSRAVLLNSEKDVIFRPQDGLVLPDEPLALQVTSM